MIQVYNRMWWDHYFLVLFPPTKRYSAIILRHSLVHPVHTSWWLCDIQLFIPLLVVTVLSLVLYQELNTSIVLLALLLGSAHSVIICLCCFVTSDKSLQHSDGVLFQEDRDWLICIEKSPMNTGVKILVCLHVICMGGIVTWNSLVTPNAKYQCMAQSPKSARGVAIAGWSF